MSIDLMRDKPTVGVPIGQGTNGSGAQLQPVNPAYNTYVGARYVPIFAGDWDATKTYEPLTIVMWQGNSYTSKTFVPAQTVISNEDFWALTGNYNAQVEVYRQEVDRLVSTVTQNNKRINRNFIVIGDSYSMPGEPESIGDALCELFHKTMDVDFFNMAVGGAAYTGRPTVFQKQLIAAVEAIPDPSIITDILVIGGYNETTNTASISSAMSVFYDDAISKFQNAKIWSIFVGASTESSGSKRAQLVSTKNAYMGSNRPFANVDASWILYTNPNYMKEDGIHPTSTGAGWVCRIIGSALNGGGYSFNANTFLDWSYNEGFSGTTREFIATINANFASIKAPAITINFDNEIQLKTWINIGTIISNSGKGTTFSTSPKMTQIISGSGYLTKTNSKIPCTVSVCFANNSIYLYIDSAENSTGYYSVEIPYLSGVIDMELFC